MRAGQIDAPAAVRLYWEQASAGLAAYRAAYQVTPEAMTDALKRRPDVYEALANLNLTSAEAERTLRVAQSMQSLVPDLPAVPIFLFAGVTGFGATVKEVRSGSGAADLGVLIPLEIVLVADRSEELPPAQPAALALLPQFVGHELTHVAQVQLQGLDRYRSLYRNPSWGTNLAFAIREGAADLLSELSSGQLRLRHRYFIAHEEEIWDEFGRDLDGPAPSSRWFSVRSETTGPRPPQLGYAVGWSICRRFYERHGRTRNALVEILSAAEPEDFLRIFSGARQSGRSLTEGA